jgi:hypothetical protein
VLADGAKAIITRDAPHIRQALERGEPNERIVVRGVIFTGPLPEHYGIVGRDNTPYLMDTRALHFLDR